MSSENLQFGVIFTADNGELVAVTRDNIKETDKYKQSLKDTGKAVRDVGNDSAVAAKQIASGAPAARGQAAALGQLATQSDVAAVAGRRAMTSQQGLGAASALAEKQMRGQGRASVQLGQQLQDAAIQAQYGASFFTILASQGSQAAFVLSQMDGGASKFKRGISSAASVLAGPWGLAIAAAVYGGMQLYNMLSDNSDAIGELTPLTNSLADAQNVLGQMYDLSTGKLKSQNELIKANILLMEIKLRTDAQAQQAEADKVGSGGLSFRNKLRGNTIASGGINGELLKFLGVDDQVGRAQRSDQKIRDIFADSKSGKLAGDKALEEVYKLPDNIFRDLKFTKTEVLEALGKQISARSSLSAADGIRNTRQTGALDARFRKPENDRDKKAAADGRGDLTAFALPFSRSTITSGFGQRSRPTKGASTDHRAIDFGVAEGTDIVAKVAGLVKFADVNGGYGNQLRLDHGAGTESRYSHLSKFNVKEGDLVNPGDVIGKVGKTGTATGAHLHYEILVNGKKVDPTKGLFGTDQGDLSQGIEDAFEKLKDFGASAGEQILRMNEQFDDSPRAVDQANAAIRQTNALIAELSERRPPGFEEMVKSAQALAPLIRDSLRRPILDMIADQEKQVAIGEALIANDAGRAEELQFTFGLMQKLGVESEAQLATELAKRGITGDQVRALYGQLDVLREQSRELDKQREKQQINLNLLGEFEGGLRDVVRGALGGDGFGAVGKGIDRIFEGYLDAMADSISDSLFGDVFAEQRDKINGLGPVKEAGEKLAVQVEAASTSTTALTAQIDTTKNALGTLVTALTDTASEISGTSLIPGEATTSAAAAPAQALPPPITVTGSRSPNKVIADTAKDLLKNVFGDKLSGQISATFKTVMQGAAIGQTASGLFSVTGVKQSKLGSQIGGAIGNAVAGPIGSIVGGILGGTVGGLFKKSKTGSAAISLADGGFSAGAVGGNNKALQGKSSQLVGNVGGSLASIAEQLGGILSDKAAVSIGYDKKGKVVVDPTGRNRTKGSGVQNFGKDGEAAAIAFATLDALKDGAITGLSEKVASALRSSSDIDKALREAVKVDEIEQILGGFGTSSKRAFVDFERQAKERLRIAGKYGFDVVKLEEENAKQRQKLLEGSIDQATGGLKSLLEDLLTGEKAPGTLIDRRESLLTKKAALEKAAPGDADAAAKLADVLEQLYQVSLDAFGTAGAQFAGDRSGIKSSAEAIIAEATAQLTAAQDKARQNAGTGPVVASSASTDALLGSGNATLLQIQKLIDEGNGQSAAMIAALAKFSLPSSTASAADNMAIGNAYRFAREAYR